MNTQISVIIPTWNEEENVVSLCERIASSLSQAGYLYEMIVIDDHSTDQTVSYLASLATKFPLRIYTKRGNQGKAISLLEGFQCAAYSTIVMIDADLQYPPEAIPDMVAKLEEGADVVVADRKSFHASLLRRIISRTYANVFGKLLHGLTVDVQSGLKVFKKDILSKLSLHPTPWSFDLDFLIGAMREGYTVASVPITFHPRQHGKAKINLVRASLELGLRSLALKFSSRTAHRAAPLLHESFSYNGKEFKPYSALPHEESALENITAIQKLTFVSAVIILLAGLLLNWHATVVAFISVITTLYFIDLLFNFFLIYRSFSKNPEIKITDREIEAIPDYAWPKYTVFCPLYKEWEVVPQFVRAMSQLDYPKEKLQVMLLLEEDDTETIREVSAMDLPAYFDTVIVPHSLPKTKPKALNYGLTKATGEYVVIYDAEDIPDPKQLKKAVISFRKAKKGTVCVQAKLNFYNPEQNLLTRLFTAEYSLWFDLVLTGLQSIKAPIPLGGTSNHFKIKDLFTLHGWDAFNVTEDCDLGSRLTKKGYATAMFDSTTLEEANSDLMNWYQQRSRWIKGYIQTYLVHMRNPKSFFTTKNEPHFFTFQFIIGGKILSLFINPLMWIVTASYFLFRPLVGEAIESLYITPVFYMGVFSLIIGNFLYLYYYMIGCAKRQQEELIPYVLFVPLYWLVMSVASWKALYEVIYKPHYWSKTKHGLHLKGNSASVSARPAHQSLPMQPAYMK